MIETARSLSSRMAAWLVLSLAALTGCASSPWPVHEVDGRPCVTFRKTHRPNQICAAAPAPALAVERQVKRFEPDPTAGQVLVHWLERGGATRPLQLGLDGRVVGELVPGGLVRLRLKPGVHELVVAWDGGRAALPLDAAAGRLVFAEIRAPLAWGARRFAWDLPDPVAARERALGARLLADIDQRALALDGVTVKLLP
jgi:hypothetical protein